MRFVLLREAGGLGDVVRTFPVARGLKERRPAARVEYVTLAGYEGLVRLSPDVDAVCTVSQRERRRRDARPDPARHAYLGRFLDQDLPGTVRSVRTKVRFLRTDRTVPGRNLTFVAPPSAAPGQSTKGRAGDPRSGRTIFVDLYCPAFRHEVETEGDVSLDRVELFCRAAGVEHSTPRLAIPAAETERARAALDAFFKLSRRCPSLRSRGERRTRSTAGARGSVSHIARPSTDGRRENVTNMTWTVGLAPYATHITRSWLGRERLVELARALSHKRGEHARALGERGCRLVFFHSWKCPRPGRDEAQARDIGAYPALRLPWPALAAHVAACDLVISVDTGILHLAGAVGVPTLGLFGPTSGEIMCRPYPTHQVLQAVNSSWRPSVDGLAGRETERCAPAEEHVRLSPRERKDGQRRENVATCNPPCYCRRSRGYSPDACGRTGCELLNRLTPDDVLAGIDRTWLGPAPI